MCEHLHVPAIQAPPGSTLKNVFFVFFIEKISIRKYEIEIRI